eukprot:scaffold31709_cov118-Isochrysis_galbana.AAC.12
MEIGTRRTPARAAMVNGPFLKLPSTPSFERGIPRLEGVNGVLECLHLRGAVRPPDRNVLGEPHRPPNQRNAKDLNLGDVPVRRGVLADGSRAAGSSAG